MKPWTGIGSLALMQPPTSFSRTEVLQRDEIIHFFGQRAEASIRLAYHLTRDREAALDISQEAIVRAMENPPRSRTPEQMRVWFNRIVVNLYRDWLRHKGAERRAMNAHSKLSRSSAGDPAESFERREAAAHLREALFTLPLDLRETIVLVCIEGYSPGEAAEMLGIPDGTLRWRMHEGRKLLKESYERLFPKE
jgi:RNA polymerase sigma-70 factor, ECF subfamily